MRKILSGVSNLLKFCILIFILKANKVLNYKLHQSVSYPSDLPIQDAIQSHPSLREIYKLANNSGIIQSLEQNEIPPPVTLFLPNNQAVTNISEKTKNFMLDKNNRDLIDTLILFSALDYIITEPEISSGVYSAKDSIVTLLSEGASIDSNAEICVNEQKNCAQIVDYIELEQGNIFILDKMLYPMEVMNMFPH